MTAGDQQCWQHSSGGGYPFGHSELVFKSIPSRMDIRLGCTIENTTGQQLGSVLPVAGRRWQTVAQFLSSGDAVPWEFTIVSADGTTLSCIRRPRPRNWRTRHERFGVCDSGGRYAGRILQNNNYLSGIRTFTLETTDEAIGYTAADYKREGPLFGDAAHQTTTIHDAAGSRIARVVERRPAFSRYCDYTLTFERPPYEPMGTLCLTATFAEYFFHRITFGGAVETFPWI